MDMSGNIDFGSNAPDMSNDKQEKPEGKSALITFSKVLLDKMDTHLFNRGFRSRSEYLSYLVRKDMEQNAQS
jgi:hypothetical protein